jgi:hypothetical protein
LSASADYSLPRKEKTINAIKVINTAATSSGALTRMTAQMESQMPKIAEANRIISARDRSFIKFIGETYDVFRSQASAEWDGTDKRIAPEVLLPGVGVKEG